MPYQKTGRPPGRPRKPTTPQTPPAVVDLSQDNEQPAAPVLTRAHRQFRQAVGDPRDQLYRPPRYGVRRRHVGRRPILHPHVIAKV